MFLGINIFWTLLRAHFNPLLTGWAKMSLSLAQNMFMPGNRKSIVLLPTDQSGPAVLTGGNRLKAILSLHFPFLFFQALGKNKNRPKEKSCNKVWMPGRVSPDFAWTFSRIVCDYICLALNGLLVVLKTTACQFLQRKQLYQAI